MVLTQPKGCLGFEVEFWLKAMVSAFYNLHSYYIHELMYMDCNIVHQSYCIFHFHVETISPSDYSFNFEKSNQYTMGFFFSIITTDNENYAYMVCTINGLILLVIR